MGKLGSGMLYITALKRCSINASLGEGFELFGGLRLTNSRKVVAGLISPHVAAVIGHLEHTSLLEADAVLYGLYEKDFDNTKSQLALDRLNHLLSITRLALVALWMHVDHAVDCELGFLEIPHKDPQAQISSNFLAISSLDATNSQNGVVLTRRDLEAVREIITNRFENYLIDRVKGEFPHELSRLHRCLYTLQAARSSEDLAQKVAFYCTCLESLFSTSAAELTHKLSERVAYFVASTIALRLTVFQNIKGAYNIRSAVVHGDQLSPKRWKEAKAVASQIDSLLREALRQIFVSERLRTIFSGPADRLEEYLIELTLGIEPSPAMK